jgi:hypothetical protein
MQAEQPERLGGGRLPGLFLRHDPFGFFHLVFLRLKRPDFPVDALKVRL